MQKLAAALVVASLIANLATTSSAQQAIEPKSKFLAFEKGGGLSGSVVSLALSHEGRFLAAAGSEDVSSFIRGFELAAASPTKLYEVKVEPGQNEAVIPSPGGKHYAYVHAFKTAQIAKFETGEVQSQVEQPEEGAGLSFCFGFFFVEKEDLLAASLGSEILAWDISSGKLKFRWPIGEEDVSSACHIGDGEVAVGDRKGVLRICELKTGAVKHVLSGKKTGNQVISLAASPDGKTLASYSFDDPGITLWDLKTHRKLRVLDAMSPSRVETILFLGGGRYVAAQGAWPGFEKDTWPIFVWDTQSGKTVAVLDEHKDNFCKLALSGDGKTLASGGSAGIVYLWDVSSIGKGGVVGRPYTGEAEEVVPRCKIDSHTTRGDTLTAKAWIDTPGEKLPSESQIAAVWKQLSGKTEKKLVLHLFVPGMNLAQPPWAIAAPSEDAAPAIQRFNERAPAKFGGGAEKAQADRVPKVEDGPNDPEKIAELKAVGFDVSVRDGRIVSVKVYPDSATDEKIARLKGLKNIKSLTVTGPTDATLEYFADLTSLETLVISGKGLDGSGLAHLMRLKQLKTLNMVYTKLNDETAENLRLFPNLETLMLSDAKISSASLGPITAMKKMRNLQLVRTQVDDAALASISTLAELEQLVLSHSRITGIGLAKLQGLKKLSHLTLQGSSIDEANFNSLHAFKHLKRLDLRDIRASDDAWIALFQALPDCAIERTPK